MKCFAMIVGIVLTTSSGIAADEAAPASSVLPWRCATPNRVIALEALDRETESVRAPHWLYFRDKGFENPAQEQAAIDALTSSYDPHAIQRRELRRTAPGLFDARDLRVYTTYIDQVEQIAGQIRVQSRWFNAVSVYVDADQLEQLRALPFIASIEPVRRGKITYPTAEQTVSAPDDGMGLRGIDYGYAAEQINQMNLAALHDQGYTGTGVRIAVLDTGFDRSHSAFNDADHPVKVIAEHDFLMNDDNTAPQDNDGWGQWHHGTWILGTIGAYKPGELVGAAYDAEFILCKTEDIYGEYQAEEDYYVAGLEFAEENGADVATSSLGYIDWYSQNDLDGRSAVTTKGVNIATENGMICCTAAGNAGYDSDPTTSHLIAPADALRVITCGAAWSDDSIAWFSSDGPSADGRQKPEVLARGVNTISVSVGDPNSYDYVSGTSLSTPLVASTVACLVQARPDWTVDDLRGRLLHSAGDYVKNGQPDPYFVRGFGVVNAYNALNFVDCDANSVDDLVDLENGDGSDVNANFTLDACEGLGDLNCDSATDFNDIDAFIDALLGREGYQTDYPGCDFYHADTNGDFEVNFNDIDNFIELLIS